MDEVESVERVIRVVDAPVHVDAASGAGMTLDHRVGIDDLELDLVGRDAEVVPGNRRDNREQRACGLPALGAAAGVVVVRLALDRNGDLPVGTSALKRAAGEIGGRSGTESLVDRGMDRNVGHGGSSCRELLAERARVELLLESSSSNQRR